MNELRVLIWKKLAGLPLEKQREVLDFIDFLWMKYATPSDVSALDVDSGDVLETKEPVRSGFSVQQERSSTQEPLRMCVSAEELANITPDDIANAQQELLDFWFPDQVLPSKE